MPRRVGPIDPVHHFPIWYADENDTVLELALATDDPFLPGLEVPPGTEVVFPTNFPDEAFYSLVEAEMIVDVPAGTTRARLVLALEAAFGGTGEVVDGQQMVFGRVRFRLDGATTGDEYTATHPYGQISATADEDGDVDVTEDIGAPQLFATALAATPWPFLRAVGAPAGYLGDGTTAGPVTGAPGTVFAVDGPGVSASGSNRDPADPDNPNRAVTSLFTVRGKEATRFGVDVRRASWVSDGAGGVLIDVVATSRPDQQVEVSGNGVEPTPMRGDGERYVARLAAAAPPAEITVTNVGDDPPFPFTVRLRDTVTITDTTYDLDASVLTAAATSSGGAALTVLSGLGDELGSPGDLPMAAPPEVVTVVSDGGGSASAQVRLTGAALPPRPVDADAGPDQEVPQGRRVRLDGSGAVGVPEQVQFAWQQTDGPPVALGGADTATPSFEAPAAGTSVTLRLTVTRTDGSAATDDVTVTVEPLTPPVAALGPDRVVPVGDEVTVDGSGSAGAASFAWSTGPGGPDLSGEDGPSVAFPMPGSAVDVTLTVDGAGGPPDSTTVTLTPEPDRLVAERPEFRTRRGQWRISGTSSATPPNRVTARLLGRNPGDPAVEIGTAAVDATGGFDIRRLAGADEPALRPGTGALVELSSSRGGRFVDDVEFRD